MQTKLVNALLLTGLSLSACDPGADAIDTSEAASTVRLRPADRVPRAKFGAVGQFPLDADDVPAFVYPSANAVERDSLLAGLAFFTTPHTAAEGAGPNANQKMCLGCHLSTLDALDESGLIHAASQVARAGRSTTTNFRVTSFDPLTSGGRAADDLNPIFGAGMTAAFTVFGDFNRLTGVFDDLKEFGGVVQHTRPSMPECLPDSIQPIQWDPNLEGLNPVTRESQTGFRRAVGERAGPPYIGRGLIEAIPDARILANEDPDDHRNHMSSLDQADFSECGAGDCISGRTNRNTSNQAFIGGHSDVRIGRFGLRAAGPTILQFVVGGANGELGFTSEFRPEELNDFVNQDNPGCRDQVADPELPSSVLLSLQQLIRLTAPPEFGPLLLAILRSPDPSAWRANPDEESVRRGAELFGVDLRAFSNRMIPGRMPAAGDGLDARAIRTSNQLLDCVGCHTPVQETGASPATTGARLLSNRWAPIFSDILLHEMPEVTPERLASTPRDPVVIRREGLNTLDLARNLADDALPNQGRANGREFRTAPLMGLGVVGPPFLHDARVYLSSRSVDSTPASTVYSNAEVTNYPLVVRSVDDALRAAIELHDLPAPDDWKTPPNGGCPVPRQLTAGEVRYAGPDDVCPPYGSETSRRNRSEAREVIRRWRALSARDQQAVIDFLKQL
jgi:Di-haem oxidoreductase, putative peroxidase